MNKERLSSALAVVALENELTHVNKNLYIDKNGIKYVLTLRGFVSHVMDNYKMLYKKTSQMLEDKEIDYLALKRNYGSQVVGSKEIEGKQVIKVKKIIDACIANRIDYEEGIKQIKKYLNV